jgi:hypothetical protein
VNIVRTKRKTGIKHNMPQVSLTTQRHKGQAVTLKHGRAGEQGGRPTFG